MLVLVLAHFVAGAAAPVLVRTWGVRAFLALSAVPAVSFGWLVSKAGRVDDGGRVNEVVQWVPSLKLDVALSMGSLQWVMGLVVTGIGTLVLWYCRWYFADEEAGLGSFAGNLTAFAGSMLGLVLADGLVVLYVFWELTTVFSYLLIGHNPAKRASRTAAMEALIVTTLGGLAMLVGVLMIGAEADTYRISHILADPPSGTSVTVAVVLVLVGALSKSALFPFHFWLPGAMAAPTPVSAYLHAAAMVKAGVFLIAVLAPAFSGLVAWRVVAVGAGLVTMLVGGWRALHQHDLKLLVAYGTVSQLGFLVAIVGIGTRTAAMAGVAMIIAHALFKAALFLVVGIVDNRAGSRDLRRLSGVGAAMPVVAVLACLAGASMAGVPPLTGYVAKESVFVAFVDIARGGDGTGIGPWLGWAMVAVLVLGSVLTVAYTVRLLWGAFADKPGVDRVPVKPVSWGFALGPAALAALSLALGFLGHAETALLTPYAEQFAAGAHEPELSLWHGLGPVLLSTVAVAGGLVLFRWRAVVAKIHLALEQPFSAERGYHVMMRLLDRGAVEATGLTQRGSLAIYLGVIISVVILLPGGAWLVHAGWPDNLDWWRTPGQALVGAVIVAAGVLATRSRHRLKGVVLVGVTGYGVAVLFLLHGAPDLALTQVLVETVTLVVFVLVLRRMPSRFTDRPVSSGRWWRAAIGLFAAVAVAGFLLAAASVREAAPISTAFAQEAVSFGGGHNIVNVTLVDIRAWDTVGELSVLVAAATGVASLIFIESRSSTIRRVFDIPYPESVQKIPTGPGRRVWLPGGRTLAPDRRSIIFEVVTRLVFHPIVVFSLYLLFSGHNNPGGGFAAGLVTGLALVVRYLAGGRYELDEAAPVDAGVVMGSGLGVATVSALVPVAFGGAALQSAVVDFHLPLLGEVHLVTSLFFDVGVYLIVVGLVLDLLRSLGSGIDRHIIRERRERDAAASEPTESVTQESPA